MSNGVDRGLDDEKEKSTRMRVMIEIVLDEQTWWPRHGYLTVTVCSHRPRLCLVRVRERR